MNKSKSSISWNTIIIYHDFELSMQKRGGSLASCARAAKVT